MCDLADQEKATLWRVAVVRARKPSACHTCGRVLPAGRRCGVTSMLFDGAWTVERACMPCHRARQAFGAAHLFYPSYSTLREYLSECTRDYVTPLTRVEVRWRRVLAAIERRVEAAHG